jgi:hypothetical protein
MMKINGVVESLHVSSMVFSLATPSVAFAEVGDFCEKILVKTTSQG